MSVLTEVLSLEGIDLGGSVPCTIYARSLQRYCDKPSVSRAHFTCLSCCVRSVEFLCADHDALLSAEGDWECRTCGGPPLPGGHC